jgi:hypothetical protein
LKARAAALGIGITPLPPDPLQGAQEVLPLVDTPPPQKKAPLIENKRTPDPLQGAKVVLPPVATPSPQKKAPPVETKQERLLRELDDPRTTHERRRDIGDLLGQLGDPRQGVGVDANGVPDIAWLPVVSGGKLVLAGQTFIVRPFYIAKYLITYTQYEAFVQAKDGFNNSEWWRDMPKEYQRQKLREQRTKSPSNPRDTISWYQSVAFGRWLNYRLQGGSLPEPGAPDGAGLIIGKNAEVRLPTEWEWQWAAQGGNQQRKYPWGNDWQAGYANTREAKLERAVAVGMYPQGAAACGAMDLAGNLWEWCLNKYDPVGETKLDNSTNVRVLRGGAFHSYPLGAAAAYRNLNDPDYDDHLFGVRVVVAPL